jgi:hypothetical protein
MRLAATLLLVLASAPVSGCLHAQLTRPPLYAAPPRPLADVPVPEDFKLKASESWVWQREHRTARLVYSGSPRADDTVAYLRDTLPAAGWRLTGRRDEGRTTLLFEGFREQLCIDVERAGGMTEIRVSLDPTDAAVEF